MKGSLPRVTVIVVTLNKFNLLRNCLRSLQTQDYEAMDILVVDNGSDEDMRRGLADEFPQVRSVRLKENQGFAGGCNRGIEKSQGKYIALINNDAVASPRWISAMVEVAEADDTIGAVASIVIDGRDPERLDSCGMGMGLDGMSRQRKRGKPVPVLNEPDEVLLFSGSACLLRRETLEKTGLFDEDFFAYCEDADLSLRIRRTGSRIVVAPGAYVRHYYSMTSGNFSLKKVYWVERNHFWVAVKNFPWPLLVLLPVTTLWRYMHQVILLAKVDSEISFFVRMTPSERLSSVYLKAYRDMFKKLPAMLAKRRSYQRSYDIGDRHMYTMIRRFRLSVRDILG